MGQVAFPGVYLEELPGGVRPIAGVSTSVTAFVGYTARGPDHRATRILSFSDFVKRFGGLAADSELGYAVQHYFANGGAEAVIVRVPKADARAASITLLVGGSGGPRQALRLTARGKGAWGDSIAVELDHDGIEAGDASRFNLTITDLVSSAVEKFARVTLDAGQADHVVSVVNDPDRGSALMQAEVLEAAASGPAPTGASAGRAVVPGVDGAQLPTTADLIGSESDGTGIHALGQADLFNLLAIPDASRSEPGDASRLDSTVDPNAVFAAAMRLCMERRAFLIVDPPPSVNDLASAREWISASLAVHEANGAAYFPRVRIADPLDGDRLRSFAPSGAIAGLFARTDAALGVWKAPAGTGAGLAGVQELACRLTDSENGVLNPLGLNCLRSFPGHGPVAWGARTLAGADAAGSEWKYVPVRRTALFLEESLLRGTQWAVLEPNGEPLWAQLRLSIGNFMHGLFLQGAFQGRTPREAWFVQCDQETTTQNDVDQGIVNVLVGFAPLKPAEFVVLHLRLIAGASQA